MEIKHRLENGKLIHEVLEKALDTQTAGEGYEWKSEGYARRPIKRVKIHQIDLNKMKSLKRARFLLRRVHWKGQFVVRGMSVDHWDLLLDKGAKCLDEFAGMENPLKQPEGVNCVRRDYCTGTPEGKPNRGWMKFYGKSIPSNHPEWGNPNKRIPAWMDKVDEGSVNIISDTEVFVSFMFHGKELKGYWIAKRESPTAEMWVFSKSSLPGEPRKEIEHARHRRDRCMECDAPPKYEVLWAEGIGRCWFCGRHFRAWALKNMKERKAEGYACDINMVREVQNGMAAKKWKENTNPDVWPKLRRELK